MRVLTWLSLALLAVLGACQVFQGPDVQATLQAEGAAYLEEATAIAQSAQSVRVAVQGTLDAGGTQAAEVNSINQQLLATARAAIPPTPERQIGDAVIQSIQGTIAAGSRYFVKTGVSSRVRSSDGCAEDVRTSFPDTIGRIYANVLVFNIEAGTPMQARWFYNEQLVWEDGWSVNRSASELCIWFYIEPSYVEFTPGNWSVRLYADGFQLEDPMFFTITDARSGG